MIIHDEKGSALFGALIGLTGAIGNNGKSPQTDRVVLDALAQYGCALSPEQVETTVSVIREEKNRIAPDCAFCAAPCGNTSDYDMKKLAQDTPVLLAKKQAVMDTLGCLARAMSGTGAETLSEVVYSSIASLQFDLAEDDFDGLLEGLSVELSRCEGPVNAGQTL